MPHPTRQPPREPPAEAGEKAETSRGLFARERHTRCRLACLRLRSSPRPQPGRQRRAWACQAPPHEPKTARDRTPLRAEDARPGTPGLHSERAHLTSTLMPRSSHPRALPTRRRRQGHQRRRESGQTRRTTCVPPGARLPGAPCTMGHALRSLERARGGRARAERTSARARHIRTPRVPAEHAHASRRTGGRLSRPWHAATPRTRTTPRVPRLRPCAGHEPAQRSTAPVKKEWCPAGGAFFEPACLGRASAMPAPVHRGHTQQLALALWVVAAGRERGGGAADSCPGAADGGARDVSTRRRALVACHVSASLDPRSVR